MSQSPIQHIELTPLGHATVLMSFDDFHLITDPVLEDRIGVKMGPFTIGQKRLVPPPMRAEELPQIDVVLLSHAHFDHLDLPTLRKLPTSATAITHRRMGDLVRRFQQVHSLTWWEETDLKHANTPLLKLTAIPSKHWGARTVFDVWRGWGGFLLELPSTPSPHFEDQPLSILFAGDTAQTNLYQTLYKRRNKRGIDLAIMPIGAYDPWIINHCSPEQAWKMAIHDLDAQLLMPIHFDTFRLSREPVGEPLARLFAAAKADDALHRLVGTHLGTPVAIL